MNPFIIQARMQIIHVMLQLHHIGQYLLVHQNKFSEETSRYIAAAFIQIGHYAKVSADILNHPDRVPEVLDCIFWK